MVTWYSTQILRLFTQKVKLYVIVGTDSSKLLTLMILKSLSNLLLKLMGWLLRYLSNQKHLTIFIKTEKPFGLIGCVMNDKVYSFMTKSYNIVLFLGFIAKKSLHIFIDYWLNKSTSVIQGHLMSQGCTICFHYYFVVLVKYGNTGCGLFKRGV